MIQSDSVTKLTDALAKAQAKFDKLKKDTTGQEGHLKFQYVQLPDVLNMVRPLLNAEGIYLNQPIIRDENGNLRLTTRVQLSEEFMQSDGIPLPATAPGKELGKIITYARRIDLMPFLGITGEEDEDAPDLKPAARPGRYVDVSDIRNRTYAPSVNDPGLAKTKDDPLPSQMYDNSDSVIQRSELSDEARSIAEEMETFVPLSDERNTQIQDRLKELVSAKLMDRRKLSLYLDAQHEGKKSLEVSATQWENTMKKIEEAVTSGPEAVKKLLKGE